MRRRSYRRPRRAAGPGRPEGRPDHPRARHRPGYGQDHFRRAADTALRRAEEAARMLERVGLTPMPHYGSGDRIAAGTVFLEGRGQAAGLHLAWKVSRRWSVCFRHRDPDPQDRRGGTAEAPDIAVAYPLEFPRHQGNQRQGGDGRRRPDAPAGIVRNAAGLPRARRLLRRCPDYQGLKRRHRKRSWWWKYPLSKRRSERRRRGPMCCNWRSCRPRPWTMWSGACPRCRRGPCRRRRRHQRDQCRRLCRDGLRRAGDVGAVLLRTDGRGGSDFPTEDAAGEQP